MLISKSCANTLWRYLLTLLPGIAGMLVLAEETLYLYNWNNYISSETVLEFERICKCKVKQDYYSDNEEMLAKLDAGAVGYDILVPTGNAVETLIRQGALRNLNLAKIPNIKNIKPEFLHLWFDTGNHYSLPYAYSITLVGYNVEKIRNLGLPANSWALIFEPRYLAKIKGKVTVLNSQKELMSAAMKYLGYSIQDTDIRKWEKAKALILRAKPYWAAFSNSTYIKDLAIGNIWVAHGYSNDMFRAREDAVVAKRPFSIHFYTPKEGAVLAVDNMVLHRSGKNTVLAHQFINFMLEGKNSAALTNMIGAGNPNQEAMALLRQDLVQDKNIFPDEELMKKLEMVRDFDPGTRRSLSRMWTEIKVK